MKLSDYVISFLVQQKVEHIFEFIGGSITHLLDSAYGRSDISCISVHHEQAGAFAAEAYSRVNGNLGVAMATSGPGALNFLTGIGSCYFDSVPCLFITGQVNTYEYKFDNPIRQIGFQETDIVRVAQPLVKYAEMVVEAKKIRYHLEKAVFLAQQGRPGPVLLDIPMDIQRADIDPDSLVSFYSTEEYEPAENNCSDAEIDQILTMIEKAERPLLLVGGGIRTARSADLLLDVALKTGIPVVTTLMGIDAISHQKECYFGMIGAYGNRYANLAAANCDLLIILGARLDSRQTGTRPETFARAAKKIHVDIDPIELNAKVAVDLAIQCDLHFLLTRLKKRLPLSKTKSYADWFDYLERCRAQFPSFPRTELDIGISPNQFVHEISDACKEGELICVDVGQHQMWVGQSFVVKNDQRVLMSGGMGAMGFALPAAIGAVKAKPGSQGVVIAGDGGIQVNIQELSLVVTAQMPIKIIVLNNGCLGMVRQFQDIYFEGRRQSTVIGYSCPDFCKVAEAYGLKTYRISSESSDHQTRKDILAAFMCADGPALLDVVFEQDSIVEPKLLVNRPIEDMSPVISREVLRDYMLIEPIE